MFRLSLMNFVLAQAQREDADFIRFRSSRQISDRMLLEFVASVFFSPPVSNDSADYVMRPCFCFFVYAADVLTDNSKKQQKDACEKCKKDYFRRKTFWRLFPNQFGIDGSQRIDRGKNYRQRAQNRRRADWHNRKCKNSVRSQLQQAHPAVLAVTCISFVALHRNASLLEPDPSSHSSQVAMMLRHAPEILYNPPRHQAEIARIQRQPYIG